MRPPTNEIDVPAASVGNQPPSIPATAESHKKPRREDERSFALSLMKYPGELVLDVGTGKCACLAAILVNDGTPVVAIDRSEVNIAAARKFLETRRLDKSSVQFLRDDITASQLSSGSFRNIVCFNILHHVPQLDTAMTELHRILASDGRLIISEFDEMQNGFLKVLEVAVRSRFRKVRRLERQDGRLVLSCEK